MTTSDARPPKSGDERTTVAAFMDSYRAAVVRKVTGLSDEDARKRIVGSATTALGIVRHLADCERWWFCEVMAGASPPYFAPEDDEDGDWRVGPDDTLADALAAYDAACAEARTAVAGLPPESLSDRASERDGQKFSLRWVHLHMLEETARHAGHLDILRELTDGSTGD